MPKSTPLQAREWLGGISSGQANLFRKKHCGLCGETRPGCALGVQKNLLPKKLVLARPENWGVKSSFQVKRDGRLGVKERGGGVGELHCFGQVCWGGVFSRSCAGEEAGKEGLTMSL